MEHSQRIAVTGTDGTLGWIERHELAQGQDAVVHLESGGIALVPLGLLEPREDGSYHLPLSRAQLDPRGSDPQPDSRKTRIESETLEVIPLAEEEMHVDRETIERSVRIHKRVSTRTERIEDAGYTEEVQVERATVNRQVDEAPSIRTEGDTIIVPLIEEVLVVEKRLMLREEVRITMKRTPHEPLEVTLRAEELEVERPEGRGE